jgi:NitT/TauT family transport system substrate-binding protein
MFKSTCTFCLSIIVFVIGSSSCSTTPTPAQELTPITLQLSWTHSSQFAGYYAAVENGDYANEGIEITFVEGGGSVDRINPIVNGEVQFGLASGHNLLAAREEGKPVRAIATIYRRSAFVFFSLPDSGITRPEDFVGKTIQIRTRARATLLEVMDNVGIASELYEEDADAGPDDLFSGEVDVATGWVTSQVLEAERAGIELNVIYPDDYGVHFFNDTIFSTEDFLAANPDLVTRFLRATLSGWRYTIENPDEAASLVEAYNPEADIAFETDSLIASIPFIHTGEGQIGWMKEDVWQGIYDVLHKQEVLSGTIDVEQVFSMDFLGEIYGEEP